MIELSYSPENHELQAIAVQKGFLAQEDAFNAKLNALEYELTQERIQNNDLTDHIEEQDRYIYRSNLEKAELQTKLKNATDIIAENEIEIKQQAKRISELLEQQAGEAVQIAPLSAEERETKLLAELNGNRTKVTNIRLKDEHGFDTRISLANNALTGEEIEFHTIYIKRYEEISETAAEQLRADYANKKAEIEAQNTVIPVMEPQPEHVEELVEDAETQPIEDSEIHSADSQGDDTSLRDTVTDEVVEQSQESEVITLESLHARVSALEAWMLRNPAEEEIQAVA